MIVMQYRVIIVACNSLIYAIILHKYTFFCWLGVVWLLQIIKGTFYILQVSSTYVGVNFSGFTAAMA